MKLFLLFALFLLGIGFGQTLVGEGDRLIYEKDKVIYEGNVKLSRGEGTLTADRVILYLDENRKAKLAEAEGNVRYVEGKRRAFADKMVYDFQRDIITLIGRARVEEGPNFVEGDRIVYYRREDRAEAVGKRVRSFYVEEKNEKVRPDKKP